MTATFWHHPSDPPGHEPEEVYADPRRWHALARLVPQYVCLSCGEYWPCAAVQAAREGVAE